MVLFHEQLSSILGNLLIALLGMHITSTIYLRCASIQCIVNLVFTDPSCWVARDEEGGGGRNKLLLIAPTSCSPSQSVGVRNSREMSEHLNLNLAHRFASFFSAPSAWSPLQSHLILNNLLVYSTYVN
jgi:hypothetical protein